MPTAMQEVSRFSSLLFARGGLLLAGGSVALLWPEGALLHAMWGAALLVAITGVYEMGLALQSRRQVRAWPVAMAHGAASIGFAVITVTVAQLPLRVTMVLAALWLTGYAMLATVLAFGMWPMRRTRDTLLAVAGSNSVLAGLAVINTRATLLTLLYAGAAYAIALGVFQLAAGAWTRFMAMPYFAPTVQSGWRAAPRSGVGRGGEQHVEGGAPRVRALHPDAPAVRVDDAAHDRQPHPGAAHP